MNGVDFMIKQPLKGMNDFIPEEAGLRDYMINQILEVYHQFGFERIYTPAIEDIENINNKEGGDNQKLIFKILKRGEKLEEAINASQFDDLSDMGLRYDLTLKQVYHKLVNLFKLIVFIVLNVLKEEDVVNLFNVILMLLAMSHIMQKLSLLPQLEEPY